MEPEELRAILAENIRVLAARRGLALNSLADFAGVSRAQVYSVLACETAPSTDWLAKLASALDVEPWQLLAPASKASGRKAR